MFYKNLNIIRFIVFLSLTGVMLISGCKKMPYEFKFGGKTMGTTYSVTLVEVLDNKDSLLKLEVGVLAELNKVNNSMSTWKKDSNLSKFNRLKAGEFMHMPKDVINLISIAKDIGAKSNNNYDITVGALVDLWGFGVKGTRSKPPNSDEIAIALKSVGIEKLIIDNKNYRLKKTVANLEVDLSSIAKGFAVDKVSEYLISQGIENFLVEIGGELRASGTKAGGSPWRVGIEKPLKDGKLEPQKIINLENFSIATSGNYKNYFKYGDKYYGHTLDPKTGKSATHNLLSVSVLAKKCALADAWATALMVNGEHKAIEIAERENLIAYFMVNTPKGVQIKYTDSFKAKFDAKK